MLYVGLSFKALLSLYLSTKVQILIFNIKRKWLKPHIFDKIKTLKNSKKGVSAFVFANGPSLNKLNAEKVNKYLLQGFDLFAVNSYITSEFAKTAPPTHYVLSDPVYFGKRYDLLTPQRIIEVKREMEEIVARNIPLFCPAPYTSLGYHNLYPFYERGNLFSSNVSDVTKPNGYWPMTAYRALSIALYMGYDAIYICGFDNDWFKSVVVDENNEIFYIDRHHYNNKGNTLKVKGILEGNSLGELLYDHHFLFKNLEKFKNYNIYNLDKDSLVDAFSKHNNMDIY